MGNCVTSCCGSSGILSPCPDDNFSLVCTLEVDGCKKTIQMIGQTQDYKRLKKPGVTDPLSLDCMIEDFEDGEAQFLCLMVSNPVVLQLTTPASAALATLECDAPTQAEAGVGPYQLANFPVVPGSVVIGYSDSNEIVTMTDDGLGVLTGDNAEVDTGTIDYATGVVAITFNDTLTTAVTFDYQFTHSDAQFELPVTSMLKLDTRITGLTIVPTTATDIDLFIGRFVSL